MTDLSDITAEDLRRYLRAEGWTEMGPSPYAVDGDVGIRRWESGPVKLDFCGEPECDLRDLTRWEGRPLSAVAADVRRLRDEAQCPRTIADGPHRRCEHCPPDEARIPALPVDPDVDDAVEALVRQHDRSGEVRPIPADRRELRAALDALEADHG